MADEELSVQVVDFMLHCARQKVFTGNFKPLARRVLGPDLADFGALDVFAEAGDREAAFLADLLAFHMDDARIDENDFLRLAFPARAIDDGEALPDSDLRRGQADAFRGVHGFEHVGDELVEFHSVEIGDVLGFLFEDRVRVLDDAESHFQ